MLTRFILGLIAVLVLLAFDKIREKSAFAFKRHDVKYIALIVIGCFGLPYLYAWKYWQFAAQIATIVFIGNFWNVIVNFFRKTGINVPQDGK